MWFEKYLGRKAEVSAINLKLIDRLPIIHFRLIDVQFRFSNESLTNLLHLQVTNDINNIYACLNHQELALHALKLNKSWHLARINQCFDACT